MKLLTSILRKEAGQALPMALILMVLGVMIIIPILDLATTNLNATTTIDQHTRDIYAADAGISDGLWKARYNYLPEPMLGEWDETTYATSEENPYSYVMHDSDDPDDVVTVNSRNVEVGIKPIWVLEGLEEPSAGQGRTSDDRLLTYGNIIDDGVYEVSIFYDGSLGSLQIERIGCWLPPGLNYVPGSSNLEQGSGQPYHCVPQTSAHNGGKKITWDYYGGIDYDDLPAQGSKRIVTFGFTPNEDPTDAFSWTRTSQDDIHLSWDTSKKIFEITSKAPSDSAKQTTIVSHSVKKEFQALGGAITGDYQATGKTLMRDHDNEYSNMRERLYKETSATISTIPNDATVEKIFLYWTGWKCKPWHAWDITDEQLNALPQQKNVHKVALKVKVDTVEMPSTVVTATETQVQRNGSSYSEHGWSYSGFADITNLVTDYFDDHSVPFYGNAQYTVGHWDTGSYSSSRRYRIYDWKDSHSSETYTYTTYPLGSPKDGGERDSTYSPYYEDYDDEDEWSHSAWSVVVIYSSPSTAGHHLYVFDQFLYCNNYQTLNFTIKGFLAPDDVANDPNAARMTCFVGEGDSTYSGDMFKVNGSSRSDAYNPSNNVWNSRSNVLGGTATDDGIDIDMFTAGDGIIQPGDTEASISIPSGVDIWNLVYIVLSFSSEITSGGVIDYNIE